MTTPFYCFVVSVILFKIGYCEAYKLKNKKQELKAGKVAKEDCFIYEGLSRFAVILVFAILTPIWEKHVTLRQIKVGGEFIEAAAQKELFGHISLKTGNIASE